MKEALVIFPHQLFRDHPGLSRDREVFLVEEQLLFSDYHYPMRFHKKKLVLHRASMKSYHRDLTRRGYRVHYLDHRRDGEMSYLFDPLVERGVRTLCVADPADFMLEKRVKGIAAKRGVRVVELPTPGFLTRKEWIEEFFGRKKRYSQTEFYIARRKGLKILMEGEKPRGGKWSFDRENRKKLPKHMVIPPPSFPEQGRAVKEAIAYVEERFGDNPGSCEGFRYPVTSGDAERCLEDFLTNRLHHFGTYQDAISSSGSFLFHSLLSSSLNTGLLTPALVVEKTLEHARRNPVPLNSLEGFIRQVTGWREFVRAVYHLEGVAQRRGNFWGHGRKIPGSLYDGTTGIAPVDTVVGRVLEHAYAHHIERLMILGNFLLLCEIDPEEVYYWFMDLFIDAFDWVMVPNVYGMSQHADGGLMTTKPYLCSSSYIRRMSDYPGGDWCRILDGLYWRFIHRHRDFFSSNPRMRVMTFQMKKMAPKTLREHIEVADRYLEGLV